MDGQVEGAVTTWHEGELRAQELAGTKDRMVEVAARLGRDTPRAHARFLAEREVLFVAAADSLGALWVSPLVGPPGFARHVGPRTIALDGTPQPGDPLREIWQPLNAVGLIAIDPATRSRIRINGHVHARVTTGSTLTVQQSYGNCPAFITQRILTQRGNIDPSFQPLSSTEIPDAARSTIERADTFYIGSAHATHGVDASHRGGPLGFVRIVDASTLEWPDYKGNGFFQTIGNLEADPRCALLFLDNHTGHMLQLSGSAYTDWTTPSTDPEVERMQRFRVEQVRWWPTGSPVQVVADSLPARAIQ